MRTLILAAAAVALTAAAGTAAAQMPSPDQIIKAWDSNGDGSVSKDEWTAAGRPADRFDRVDANHDGKVTAEELGQAMAKMRQRRQGGAAPSSAEPPSQPPAGDQPN
jgi:hypothetical protein